MIELIITQWKNASIPELVGLFCTLAFAWFAGSENKIAWLFCAVNLGISVVLFSMDGEHLRGTLCAILFMMSLWGYYLWHKRTVDNLFITRVNNHRHIILFSLTLCLALLISTLSFVYTGDARIIHVAFYSFGVLVLYFTINKDIEAWFYWAIINITSAYLAMQNQNYLGLSVLLLYVPLTIRGLYIWTNRYYNLLGKRMEKAELKNTSES